MQNKIESQIRFASLRGSLLSKISAFRVFTIAAILVSSSLELGIVGYHMTSLGQIGTSAVAGVVAAALAKAIHLI